MSRRVRDLRPGDEQRALSVRAVTEIAERDFMQTVIDAARVTGWLVYHTFHSKRSPSGFPDLVLVRERVVFAELKAAKTRITTEQMRWLDALDEAGGEVYLWRPDEWDEIERVLGKRTT
jgi:VRR-NUC domain